MRVYVPGTFFQVSKDSSLIELVSDEKDLNTGIWISWYEFRLSRYQFILVFHLYWTIYKVSIFLQSKWALVAVEQLKIYRFNRKMGLVFSSWKTSIMKDTGKITNA